MSSPRNIGSFRTCCFDSGMSPLGRFAGGASFRSLDMSSLRFIPFSLVELFAISALQITFYANCPSLRNFCKKNTAFSSTRGAVLVRSPSRAAVTRLMGSANPATMKQKIHLAVFYNYIQTGNKKLNMCLL